jgi:hypothetical protein
MTIRQSHLMLLTEFSTDSPDAIETNWEVAMVEAEFESEDQPY